MISCCKGVQVDMGSEVFAKAIENKQKRQSLNALSKFSVNFLAKSLIGCVGTLGIWAWAILMGFVQTIWYRKTPKYLERQAPANSVDPDHMQHLIRVCTVFTHPAIFYTHQQIVKWTYIL